MCVSTEKTDVRGLLTSWGEKKTEKLRFDNKATLVFRDYSAALSHLCSLSFEDFPQMITIVLLLYLMINLNHLRAEMITLNDCNFMEDCLDL